MTLCVTATQQYCRSQILVLGKTLVERQHFKIERHGKRGQVGSILNHDPVKPFNLNCWTGFNPGIIHRKEIPMTPSEFTQHQVERYRQMTGEEWLLIALNLHEMPCEIARDCIRGRYPNATPDAVEMKLYERLRLAY